MFLIIPHAANDLRGYATLMQGDLHGTVGVLGYGVDGQAVVQFLWEKTQDVCRGAPRGRPGLERIVVFDDASSEFRLPTSNVVIDKLTTLDNVDLLFRSPGFPLTHPLVVAAKEKGIPITSSTTHFLQHFPGVTVGVTGSNGKTTCVALITEMLKAEYGEKRVERGGNDGIPRLDLLWEIAEGGSEKRVPRCFDKLSTSPLGMTRFSEPHLFVVLELSSFQLIDCPISPNVAVVLNLTPNHLDWHASMEEYIEAKRRIVAHQRGKGERGTLRLRSGQAGKGDVAILNQNDPIVRGFAEGMESDVRWFEDPPPCAVRCRTHPDTIRAAVTTARALGVSERNIIRVLEAFPGVPHRLEFVRELNGVKYYNDSSSTTPESAIVACNAFSAGSLILLLGGRDKGMDFSRLYEVIKERNVRVVLYGEMAPRFAQALPRKSQISNPKSQNFEAAVLAARTSAASGDHVVLSPACASFDMFRNAKERGGRFVELVRLL